MNIDNNKEQLSFEKLVVSSSFIEWVQHTNQDSADYWNNWLAVNPHQLENIHRAKAFLQLMNGQKELVSYDEIDEQASKLLSTINNQPGKLVDLVPFTQRKFWGLGRVISAASVILVVLATVIFFAKNTYSAEVLSKITKRGERSTIELSDGSTVILNVDSRLDYPREFGTDFRVVALKGEAVFNVQRNERNPFIVKTGDIDIQVLGTSFNISTYANESESTVELLSGAVMVKLNDKEKSIVALRPFEKLIYDKTTHQWKIEQFESEDVIGWKDGLLTFDHTPINEITKELERWFDVKIITENKGVNQQFYTGRFQTTNLDKIISGLCFSWNASYEIKGKNVVIRFRK